MSQEKMSEKDTEKMLELASGQEPTCRHCGFSIKKLRDGVCANCSSEVPADPKETESSQ